MWALVSAFGTHTQDISAFRLSCTMVKLCASPSLGMDTRPGTRKVALKFPLDETDAPRNCIGSMSLALPLYDGEGSAIINSSIFPRPLVLGLLCLSPTNRSMSRFHGDNWGTPSPKVGVEVSSVSGTSSHGFENREQIEYRKQEVAYLSGILCYCRLINEIYWVLLGAHIDSNIIECCPCRPRHSCKNINDVIEGKNQEEEKANHK